MNQQVSLERKVAVWMADEVSGVDASADRLIDQIITTTGLQRPRPRWLALLQESPMHAQSQVVVGSPTRRLGFVAVLLVVAALFAAAVGAALLLQPKPIAEEWPGFRGDASHRGLGVHGPIGNPVVAWTYHASGGVRNNISIARNLAIAPSDDGVLRALGADDGSVRWSFTAASPMGGPFVAGDRVFVGDGAGIVHALDIADGHEVWATTATLRGVTSPTRLGDRLFVGTSDGLVVAINAATGAESWRATVSQGSGPVHVPVVGEGEVVAATDDGHLVALEPASGTVRWNRAVTSDPVGNPMVADGLAFLGGSADSGSGRLVAVDVATGNEVWHVDENLYSPSVADGIAYTGSADGSVTARDLKTGAERWRVPFKGLVRAPAIAGDVIYVTAEEERQIAALDRATGGELWTFDVDGPNDCCIAAAGGKVYLGTSLGTVYAIGGDGAKLTAKAPPSNKPSAPASPTPAASAAPTLPPLDASLVWATSSGAADFNPWGLALAPDGRLWAAEGFKNQFSIFEPDGTFVESWGEGGSANGTFDLTRGNGDPYGMLAFAPDGSFYVLDVGNHRVQRFDASRAFVGAWGGFGTGRGQFNDPVGLVVDGDGNVSVLDDVRGVIETYDPSGRVLASIPAFPSPIRSTGGANQLGLGPDGHFFLTVTTPREVIELDRDGRLIREYGAPGTAGEFHEQPMGMAFDAAGRLYVGQGPYRGEHPGILVFDRDGTYLGGFGPVGGGQADLGFPWGIVVTDEGIYNADAGGLPDVGYTSLIRKFAPISFP